MMRALENTAGMVLAALLLALLPGMAQAQTGCTNYTNDVTGQSESSCPLALASCLTGTNPLTGKSLGLDPSTGKAWQPYQVTGQIVTCVQASIINAEENFINALTSFLTPTIAAFFVVMVMIFGIKLLASERDILKNSAAFMMRLSVVSVLVVTLNNYATVPFKVSNQVLTIVTGGDSGGASWSPWDQIDMVLGTLLGYAPGTKLFQGMLGIIGSSMFAQPLMAGISLIAIFFLLLLLFCAVYTYIMATVLMGFMMAVLPMLLPLFAFGHTERYFRRWWDIMIAALLQQLMLFAYMWIFLGVVDYFVAQVFAAFPNGNDFAPYWHNNTQYFSWSVISDPALNATGGATSLPIVQPISNALMPSAMDYNAVTHPTLDFGPNGPAIMQSLINWFLPMAMTCYMMHALLKHIPTLAEQIAGVSTGIVFSGEDELMGLLKQGAGAAGGK